MFRKLQMKIASFMYGRNGFDNLSYFLLILWFIIIIIFDVVIFRIFRNLPLHIIFDILQIALFIYIYYRVFSKNIAKRQKENTKYLEKRAAVQHFFKVKESRRQRRKTHKLFKCPQCGQMLSVPKGKGKITIKCPKCGNKFSRRS